MASVFVIIAESGDVKDYTTHNVCAYTDGTVAEKVCEVLNLITLSRRKFADEDLRGFISKYHLAHPAPIAPKQERFSEVYPELPAEFVDIAKEERKGPEYEKYLQAVADYKTKLATFKTALLQRESESQKAFEEWESAYQIAIAEFKTKFDLDALIPEDLTEQIQVCLPYAEDATSFLLEEIDLLP